MRVLALANQAIFWKAPKPTWLWQSAVTKPLQLQNIVAYPWKDNVHIFHLAHSFSESSHQCSCGDFLKKVASCGKIQIWRNISSSFVLYASILTNLVSGFKIRPFNISQILGLWHTSNTLLQHKNFHLSITEHSCSYFRQNGRVFYTKPANL